jgi:curved DNA-binding protein CbpA
MRDPYLLLGLNQDADSDAVERAYHAAIRQCPPERDPERFAAIREAYEQLRTQRDRLGYELFDTSAPTPMDVLDRAAPVGARRRPNVTQLQALLRGAA